MMNIDIAGRHVEITKALRTFIEDRLHKLESLLDGPSKAHVVLASAKHRHLAEILLGVQPLDGEIRDGREVDRALASHASSKYYSAKNLPGAPGPVKDRAAQNSGSTWAKFPSRRR